MSKASSKRRLIILKRKRRRLIKRMQLFQVKLKRLQRLIHELQRKTRESYNE